MSTRVVVTGGAGFIGSHLVDRLLQEDQEVVVTDNFATGRKENLQHVADHPRLEMIDTDICDGGTMQKAFEGATCVFHLAALADIVPSIQRPLEYMRTNLDGTLVVLEAARAAGVSKFVYAASSSCYGIPDTYPTSETAPPRPQYPYALSKYLGEQCVLHWEQTYGLPCVSLRLFNVFGPRSRTSGTYGAVFGVFLAQKLSGQPYTVVGDGTQERDFIFVSDVVEAFVTAARSDVSGQVMNVGTGKASSINELVELLGGPVVNIPKRPGEPDCTLADTSRIRSLIDWESQVSFPEGVAQMLEHIDSWRDAPVWTPDKIADATLEWFRYLDR